MRRLLTPFLVSALSVAFAGIAPAQSNPRGSAKLSLNGQTVSVEYGRPALKGRSAEQMLDRLQPGEVWRLGADQSTTFSTTTDLAFGDVTIPKGKYSLWVRRGAANSWRLVFNKRHGQWGTEHDPAQDLAGVPLKQEKEANSAERVTIELENERGGGEIAIRWGNLELTTYFKAM